MRQIDSPRLTVPEGAAYVRMRAQEFRDEVVRPELVPSYVMSERKTLVHRADLDAYVRTHGSAAAMPETLRSATSS